MASPGRTPTGDRLSIALAALEGGADSVQLRAPELADTELLPLAATLAERCRSVGVLFLVNDRVEVALEAEADGVHLGQRDEPDRARRRLGSSKTLGLSVGNVTEARAAAALGADYLGATVWASPTKRDSVPIGLSGLAELARVTQLPVVGIGGITAENAVQVVEAGASAVAVISAVASAADPVEATRALVAALGPVPGASPVPDASPASPDARSSP